MAWTRTSLAFAAIGATMLKNSPVAGAVVLALSIPIWGVARRAGRAKDARTSRGEHLLVTLIVVAVALAALVVALTGNSPAGLGRLPHDS
jgi:uncharacterized membrane protein YidH (DUF202 family)